MRMCIVTEFGQDDYFQWRVAWNLDKQIKMGTIVDSLTINPDKLSLHPDTDTYWKVLSKADLVFCYASRTNPPNTPYNRQGIQHLWNWWELPKIAKRYMRPEAKMIAQNDDDWIWLEHPEWVWWEDDPDTHGGPANFFKDTGILEVPDMWFTVLDNPNWTKFTNKPVKYMPLPHLWRYTLNINSANTLYQTNGLSKMHKQSVALMKHTSVIASIDSTVKNVIEKVGLPVTYFSTQWTHPSIGKYKVPINTFLYLNRDQYMNMLRDDCIVAIDDVDNYVGWSRFVMECAINYVPCIGSNFANKIFFPDLFTEHNDFAKQIELIKKLLNDNAYYKKVVDEAHTKVFSHLNPDGLCNEMIRLGKEELHVSELAQDTELELVKNILRKILPFALIPPRPSSNQNVYDDFHHRQCDQAQWDIWYGSLKHIIHNDSLYNKTIREICDEK